RFPRWWRRGPWWRWWTTVGYRAQARHHAARPSRQRPRLLSLQLQRQRQGLCRRDGAGGANRHAGSGRARPRRLPAGVLRPARPHVPNLRAMDRIGGADSVCHADRPLTSRSPEPGATEGVMTTNSSFGDARPVKAVPKLAAAAVAVLLLAMASAANAQQSFKSAEEAADALVTAARSGDRRAMLTVLGRDGADIVSSGDAVADAATRQQFLAAYDAKHQVAMEGDSKAILIVGQDDFPFPIPLMRQDGAWQFDTAAGRDEILFRRIGRNELRTIQTCLAYIDAQNEYAEKGVAGNGVYAQRIVSRPGQKDGLYWPAQSGDDESPLGDLAAGAAAEGYRAGPKRQPQHGYYEQILPRHT